MSSSIGYALRAEHKDTFAGATLCVGSNGESLDTAQALKDGSGVIVVPETEPYTVAALDQHPQFERVAVPDATPEPVVEETPARPGRPARGAAQPDQAAPDETPDDQQE